MKTLYFFLLIILLSNCNKPKTVLICGDHICINNKEAEQYFEENLTIEVKVLDKNVQDSVDLVELNMTKSQDGGKKISIASKDKTNNNLKTLSNNEVREIKKKIKNTKEKKEVAKKNIKQKKVKKTSSKKKQTASRINKDNNQIKLNNVNKKPKNVADVCTILEKCSIDEISKFLLEQGKKKDFPDITKRQ